jgi:hypothetical protein
MAVIAAIAREVLCVDCIAKRIGLPTVGVLGELRDINAGRRRRSRPTIGPFQARCHGCEALASVYRLGDADR